MRRRELLYSISVLGGYALVGGIPVLQGCNLSADKISLANLDTRLLDELGEIIIPATASSSGARAAQIGHFIKTYVTDCYTKADQLIFIKGIQSINDRSGNECGKPFTDLTSEQKSKLLSVISTEAIGYHADKGEEQPNHYFIMLQELTVLGYFTSKVGATRELRCIPVPGKFVGEIEYKKGDKCWALV